MERSRLNNEMIEEANAKARGEVMLGFIYGASFVLAVLIVTFVLWVAHELVF